ncbi:GNAT family N-acetyltransferase [Nocardioides bruguierae]|uniref:GNAT family N-acetyltransferase n=1 Tax=Nocardioides bruguierae TaxID=2945102 RepID=UPI0020216411|nr:GNAT family N-acetyltransferase [Nocardioides bruguierae]MCL8024336.1 GNAT family N-acetyltransferase [Nocardioides bruguierae]
MTPPVTLRAFTLQDADVVASWALDPAFVALAGWSCRTAAEHREHQRRLVSRSARFPGWERLAATTPGLGVVGYLDLAAGPDATEVGYAVGPSARWGRGLGSAVLAAGVVEAGRRGLPALLALVSPAHARSRGVLRACGFTRVHAGADTETWRLGLGTKPVDESGPTLRR